MGMSVGTFSLLVIDVQGPSKPVSRIPLLVSASSPCLEFLPWFLPLKTDCNLQTKIEPLLMELLLVLVFSTATESKLRKTLSWHS